jgi:hypothetical protein
MGHPADEEEIEERPDRDGDPRSSSGSASVASTWAIRPTRKKLKSVQIATLTEKGSSPSRGSPFGASANGVITIANAGG